MQKVDSEPAEKTFISALQYGHTVTDQLEWI